MINTAPWPRRPVISVVLLTAGVVTARQALLMQGVAEQPSCMMGEAASQLGTVFAMSTQIAVRLPDELVAYVDQAVATGRVKSRADLLSRLLARDARRQRAEDDLQRLVESGSLPDAETLAMVLATSGTPVGDD